MFRPPFCPHRDCRNHHPNSPDFYVRFGTYRAACRAHRVPRFRCRSCRRTFSRQTFRADFRDRRPEVNAPLLELLTSGVGLRQSARVLSISMNAVERKARKIARHLRRLHLNLSGALSEGVELQFDELETYETRRNTRPLTVGWLLEKESRFLIWSESAPIRPRGSMSKKRIAAIREDEARFGPRRDLSARCVERTLARGIPMVSKLDRVSIHTDEKSTYPYKIKAAFGKARVAHSTTNSKLARQTWNPLFALNHEEARARDLLGRLRRESWLVSKKRRWLDLALHLHIAYRNYVKRRFNRDDESPASALGLVARRLRVRELLSWRQEAGGRSLHPLGRGRLSVDALVN